MLILKIAFSRLSMVHIFAWLLLVQQLVAIAGLKLDHIPERSGSAEISKDNIAHLILPLLGSGMRKNDISVNVVPFHAYKSNDTKGHKPIANITPIGDYESAPLAVILAKPKHLNKKEKTNQINNEPILYNLEKEDNELDSLFQDNNDIFLHIVRNRKEKDSSSDSKDVDELNHNKHKHATDNRSENDSSEEENQDITNHHHHDHHDILIDSHPELLKQLHVFKKDKDDSNSEVREEKEIEKGNSSESFDNLQEHDDKNGHRVIRKYKESGISDEKTGKDETNAPEESSSESFSHEKVDHKGLALDMQTTNHHKHEINTDHPLITGVPWKDDLTISDSRVNSSDESKSDSDSNQFLDKALYSEAKHTIEPDSVEKPNQHVHLDKNVSSDESSIPHESHIQTSESNDVKSDELAISEHEDLLNKLARVNVSDDSLLLVAADNLPTHKSTHHDHLDHLESETSEESDKPVAHEKNILKHIETESEEKSVNENHEVNSPLLDESISHEGHTKPLSNEDSSAILELISVSRHEPNCSKSEESTESKKHSDVLNVHHKIKHDRNHSDDDGRSSSDEFKDVHHEIDQRDASEEPPLDHIITYIPEQDEYDINSHVVTSETYDSPYQDDDVGINNPLDSLVLIEDGMPVRYKLGNRVEGHIINSNEHHYVESSVEENVISRKLDYQRNLSVPNRHQNSSYKKQSSVKGNRKRSGKAHIEKALLDSIANYIQKKAAIQAQKQNQNSKSYSLSFLFSK